jgi:type IV secretory pathway TraG/TraD family ATPase VirD4
MVGAARPGARTGEAAHWTERAEALLAPLLHAAALDGLGMTEVVSWVNRHDLEMPLAILAAGGVELAFDILAGLMATHHRELSSIWSTASGVLSAYRSAAALASTRDPNIDATALTTTTDTVYICATGRHQALASPLVVGLLEQVRAGAYDAATAPGQGSSPPLTLALDEVANIAPIPDLPTIVSEGGSQGLLTLACLQDLSQARVRWGEAADGFFSLFGARVILPGIGDRRTLELVSVLGGELDRPVRSVHRTPWWTGGRGSVTVSTQRQRRLPVDAVSQLPPGSALLLEGARPPALISLTPWWETPPFAPAPRRGTPPFTADVAGRRRHLGLPAGLDR